MRFTVVVAAVAALVASVPAASQSVPVPRFPVPGAPVPGVPRPAVPGALAGQQSLAQQQAMLGALEAAQSAAVQPGDELLSCEALQEQLTAVVTDQAVNAQIAAGGAAAQRDLAAIQAAQRAIPAQTAASAAAALTPGGGAAATAAAMAQAQAAQAAAAQRMQSRAAQAEQVTALMPKFMRGERLMTLAAAKNCAWVNGFELGSAPPSIPAARGDGNE
jgi:hypothetical protein